MQLSRPISVFLNITNDCNLACKYCSSPKINKGQLTDEQLLALMVELAEFGVFRLILTGGEPLVHPLTLDIIHQYSARFSFTVNTNGSLVDSCVAALLRKNNVKVNLSLDHFDPAKNDSVRGGTVSAIAGLRHLVDAGVDVTLLVTVSRVNQYDIRDICAWAFEQGVKRVSFNPIISIGKAEKAPHLILDIDDNLLLVETFSAVLAEYPNVSAEYWLAAVELLRRFKQADMSTRAKCSVA